MLDPGAEGCVGSGQNRSNIRRNLCPWPKIGAKTQFGRLSDGADEEAVATS